LVRASIHPVAPADGRRRPRQGVEQSMRLLRAEGQGRDSRRFFARSRTAVSVSIVF
jgi:hypothetical protein